AGLLPHRAREALAEFVGDAAQLQNRAAVGGQLRMPLYIRLQADRFAGLQPELQIDVHQLDEESGALGTVGSQVIVDRRRLAAPPGFLKRLDQPLAARPRRTAEQRQKVRTGEAGSCHPQALNSVQPARALGACSAKSPKSAKVPAPACARAVCERARAGGARSVPRDRAAR